MRATMFSGPGFRLVELGERADPADRWQVDLHVRLVVRRRRRHPQHHRPRDGHDLHRQVHQVRAEQAMLTARRLVRSADPERLRDTPGAVKGEHEQRR